MNALKRLYQRLRPEPPREGFRNYPLEPSWVRDALAFASQAKPARPKRVFFFGVLRYWTFHEALIGLVLRGKGHQVWLGHLPYKDWFTPASAVVLARQDRYNRHYWKRLAPAIDVLSLWTPHEPDVTLPEDLMHTLAKVTDFDVQYTAQSEQVDTGGDLYRLRWERNLRAAKTLWQTLKRVQPDVLVVPNGMIIEFAVAYHVARHLGITTVTYEFEEQRGRLWIDQNAPVMLQETDSLWRSVQDRPFLPTQRERIRAMLTARKQGELWENFSRRWQKARPESGEAVRRKLRLDDRPLVLLAPNVFGDSVVFDRQVFTQGMRDWVQRTVDWFARHPEVQLVVRIHPGESLLQPGGMSMQTVIEEAFPQLPENVCVVPHDADVNSYDLIEIASLGIVYTSTIGMEMAMSGLPVVVCGKTHYRNRGFTLDPDSWEAYWRILEEQLRRPQPLSEEQVDRAWKYAYHFFFDYPQPFPWHIGHLEEDLETWPVRRVLTEGRAFDRTFDYFAGEPIQWDTAA